MQEKLGDKIKNKKIQSGKVCINIFKLKNGDWNSQNRGKLQSLFNN